jgi:signal peptidase I
MKIIKNIKEFAIIAFGSIILTILISCFVQVGQVVGMSMTNTLQNNELVLINKMAYKSNAPKYKDIIALHADVNGGEPLIKRVIGVPGDTIEIKDNKVYVNNNELNEDYIKEVMEYNQDMKIVIPDDKIFVMGDNRNNSLDSRSLMVGMIDYKKDVIGKIIVF